MNLSEGAGLAGRRAIVTGGASGIGAAIVTALSASGARVTFLDIDAEAGRSLERQLAGTKAVRCDLRDIDAVKAEVTAAAEAMGGVDIVVNNAASDERHQFASVTSQQWDDLIAVNLKHQYFVTQAALPFMRAGASVINLSSISWRRGATDVPVYSVAKAGVEGLTRMLARELGPLGIRANAVLPGMVLTERQLRLWLNPQAMADALAAQCLKEHVQPQDIADCVAWLASPRSRMVTGQAIVVDGGWI